MDFKTKIFSYLASAGAVSAWWLSYFIHQLGLCLFVEQARVWLFLSWHRYIDLAGRLGSVHCTLRLCLLLQPMYRSRRR